MHGMQSTESGSRSQREEEVTLVVCSENPRAILEAISALTVIGDFRLHASDTLNVHDRYFDTADMSLWDRHVVLRLRQIESKRWITFKGPSRTDEDGFASRLEVEAEWSDHALTETLNQLAKSGIELPLKANAGDRSDPLDLFNALGLVVVQDRETLRMVRNIVPLADDGALAAAQLVLDSVSYRFHEMNVRHSEVEIEALTSDGARVLKTLAENLRDRFGGALQRWNHSKLATGWAIENLWHDLDMAGCIKDGHLLPAAYEQIDRFLR
ncbi:MAG: CYTH domain-containing protein [Deltaproteobacteria bacterium]